MSHVGLGDPSRSPVPAIRDSSIRDRRGIITDLPRIGHSKAVLAAVGLGSIRIRTGLNPLSSKGIHDIHQKYLIRSKCLKSSTRITIGPVEKKSINPGLISTCSSR